MLLCKVRINHRLTGGGLSKKTPCRYTAILLARVMSLPVLKLRAPASRAVLAMGLDLRQLLDLSCPLNREMEIFEKLEGTYLVNNINIMVEKNGEEVFGKDIDKEVAEVYKVIRASNLMIEVGQVIKVEQPLKEKWSLKCGVKNFKFTLVSPRRSRLVGAITACYLEDRKIVKSKHYAMRSTLQQSQPG